MNRDGIKVSVIGSNGIPARYGGFETLAEYLTKELGSDLRITVYCSSLYSKKERIKTYNNAKLIYLPFKANGIQSLLYDSISTLHALIRSDVLLILGPAVGFITILNKVFRKKIITNHGGLNEWEREKFSFLQKRYAFLSHKLAGKYSDINIADNYPLKEKLSQTFGVSAEVIEYGGDHVNRERITPESLIRYPFLPEPYALCVARAQMDNNLHLLIECFIELEEENLVIVSNWGISTYGQSLKEKYMNVDGLYLVDAVYNKKDLDIIRSNTKLYIHSHSECGTAPSLVEAMNYNIPIICYDVETNRKSTEGKSYYFSNVGDLKSLINNLNNIELAKLRESMYDIAIRRYSWKVIGRKYYDIIQRLSRN
jgi:glycosyltransferase involved in cell wall biosynthesis